MIPSIASTEKERIDVREALKRRRERMHTRMPLDEVNRLWQQETSHIFDAWMNRMHEAESAL